MSELITRTDELSNNDTYPRVREFVGATTGRPIEITVTPKRNYISYADSPNVAYQEQNDLADQRMIEKEQLERRLSGYTPGRMLYTMSAPWLFSPSNYAGFLVDIFGNNKSLGDAAYRWLSGTNSGVVTEDWGNRNPYGQLGANFLFDVGTTMFMPTSIGTKTTSMKLPSTVFRSATDDIVRGPYATYMITPDGAVVARSITMPTAIADVMPRTVNLPIPQIEVLGSAKPAPAFAAIEAADTSVGNAADNTAANEGSVAGGASDAVDNSANNQQGNQQGNNQQNNQQPQNNQPQGNQQPQNNQQQGNNIPENKSPKKTKTTTEYQKLSKSKKTGQDGVNEIVDSYANGNITREQAETLLKAKKLESNIYDLAIDNLNATTKLIGQKAKRIVVEKQSKVGGFTNFMNNAGWKSGSFNFSDSPVSSTIGRLFPFATLTGGIYGYNQLTKDKNATSKQNTEITTEKTDTTSVNTNKQPQDSIDIRYIESDEEPFVLE